MAHIRHKRRVAAAVIGVAGTALALVSVAPGGASPATTSERHASANGDDAVGGATLAERSRSADDGLTPAFRSASRQYDVPQAVLFTLGYAETHLDSHDGEPSFAGGYGVMHLVDNPTNHTLATASRLTGMSTQRLKTDSAANIEGAAAVLRRYADRAGLDRTERDRVAAWYPIVARYGHASRDWTARLYADTVYDYIASGVRIGTEAGDILSLRADPNVRPERGRYATVDTSLQGLEAGFPGAIWNPADPSNYTAASRGAGDITAVVIHTTQGSYAGTISWFQNPDSNVGAHYVIRSSDGEITQMVDDSDIGWHARDGNSYSIGIEHEGFVDDPSWYTDAMYTASAQVTAYACSTYGFTCDRSHVVGHSEVPGNDHTDPGPYWDWDYYMALVTGTEPPEYNFTTWGEGVNVREDAYLSSPVVTTIPGPTQVFVECQKQGDLVEVDGYSNDWWAKLRDQGGFMSQVYVDHPESPLPDVPTC
jgi:N-acetylmuramoyl-L-alanine amidase